MIALLIFLGLAVSTTVGGAWFKGKGRRFGLQLNHVTCPTCDARMPIVRRPRSKREALWGGWTCPKCGTEMDKFGSEIGRSVVSQPKLDASGKTPLERVFEQDR